MGKVRAPDSNKKIRAGGTKPLVEDLRTRLSGPPATARLPATSARLAKDSPRTHDTGARLLAVAAAEEPPAPPKAPAKTKADNGPAWGPRSASDKIKNGAGSVADGAVPGADPDGSLSIGGFRKATKLIKLIKKLKDLFTVTRDEGELESRRIERDPGDLGHQGARLTPADLRVWFLRSLEGSRTHPYLAPEVRLRSSFRQTRAASRPLFRWHARPGRQDDQMTRLAEPAQVRLGQGWRPCSPVGQVRAIAVSSWSCSREP